MIEFKKRTFEWLYPCLVAFIVIVISILVFFLSAKAVTLLMVPQGGTGAGTFTAGGILQGDGTGAIQSNIMSGDGTLSAGGVLTVSADAVETITVEGKAAEDIDLGEAVYISGAVGNNVQFSLADNTVDGKTNVAGVAIESKTAGQTIRVRHVGQLDNFDTSAWADGDDLYLSTAGSLINTVPTSGTTLHVAYVEYSHASLGDILLHVCGEKNIGAPASTDLFLRMGDNAGTNKLSYRDYANNEIANIDSDGNAYFGGSVGIGITTPAQLFHMQGNGTAAQGWARFGLSSSEYTEIGHKGNNSAINAVGDGNLDFRHDSVTKMSLTDAGVLTATTFTGALSGNATTATALAANGANCAIGNYPLGVNASGAVESCTPIGGGGDITDVFDCATGNCNTMTVGTSEYLVYGSGYIDANRFAGVTTVDATEFGYLNGVTSAIQTQFGGKQGTLTNSAGLLAALSDETGTGLSVFGTSPTFTTGITVPNDSISAAELNEGDAFTWTSTHDFGGATSLEIPNGAAPTVDSVGETAVDTTSDQLVYYGSAKRVLQEEDTKCFSLENLAADDDNYEFYMANDAITITAIGLHCAGTCTTGADISLEDRAGNAMTHTTPTHSTGSGNTTFQSVTNNNTLVSGEGLRFDVDNAVSPETDTYLICFKMKYTSD